MVKVKGVNAAAWFYSQPGFHRAQDPEDTTGQRRGLDDGPLLPKGIKDGWPALSQLETDLLRSLRELVDNWESADEEPSCITRARAVIAKAEARE